jgi:hypothetical protein
MLDAKYRSTIYDSSHRQSTCITRTLALFLVQHEYRTTISCMALMKSMRGMLYVYLLCIFLAVFGHTPEFERRRELRGRADNGVEKRQMRSI